MDGKKGMAANNSSHDEDLKPSTIMRNVYAAFSSFALLAGMQLDVFTPLHDGPMEAKTLAAALEVQVDKLTPLLYSLAAAGLLEVENNSFSNTPEAGKFLVRGSAHYIGGLSGFYNMLYRAALNTAQSIRTGKPQAKVDYHTLPEEELLRIFREQVHSSLRGGRKIAEKLDFLKYKRLLDAGGGTGGAAMAICNKYPQIKATVADLPKVEQLARHFIDEAGMSGAVSVSATDLCLHPGSKNLTIPDTLYHSLLSGLPLTRFYTSEKIIFPGVTGRPRPRESHPDGRAAQDGRRTRSHGKPQGFPPCVGRLAKAFLALPPAIC